MEKYIKERLDATVFVVEANSFERQCLWQTCKERGQDTWESLPDGYSVDVGELAERPVCMTLWWVRLNGSLVMFYEPTSVLVDHKMIETWLTEHCNPRYDSGTRRAHTNGMNFGHCLHYTRDLAQARSA